MRMEAGRANGKGRFDGDGRRGVVALGRIVGAWNRMTLERGSGALCAHEAQPHTPPGGAPLRPPRHLSLKTRLYGGEGGRQGFATPGKNRPPLTGRRHCLRNL